MVIDIPFGFHCLAIGIGKEGLKEGVSVVGSGVENAHGHFGPPDVTSPQIEYHEES